MTRFVVISGCSGGGKSTLLETLRQRGEIVVEEPGRRIVAEELSGAGNALPWVDAAAFARRAIEMSLSDMRTVASVSGRVYFDRGLIDAASALEHVTGQPIVKILGDEHRFHRQVFMAPPWAEIHIKDDERRHDFNEAVAEYERLDAAYRLLGYDVVILPKVSVSHRADFVLSMISDT